MQQYRVDLEERLVEILRDCPPEDKARREEVERVLTLLKSNITPSARAIRSAFLAARGPGVCARLLSDGSCAWLRVHGTTYPDLRDFVPPVGEKAVCPFRRPAKGSGRLRFHECSGFSERR